MINLNSKYRQILERIKDDIPFEPEICIVLGSGLGDFANKIETIKSISTSNLPEYPVSTIPGHKGYLHFSKYADKKLFVVQGRIHFYEGYKISECVLPIHLAAKLNCKKIILTNAAGGVNPNLIPGDLMLIRSFISFNIKKELTELVGLASIDIKNSMLDFPSEELNEIIIQAALQEKILLREGNYWYTKGPNYETPSEIKMIQKFGGDAVGMSTVHEAFYANIMKMKVAAISCITNYAAGLSSIKLSHDEVIETAEKAKSKFERLIKKSIELM
ncbi:purine-nucleoside phosphorylase [Rosettibacter firmus]|uniref:purine-nucleoside phosphorylase n=1 Tax=Rosettibacter firmus TaxID=3111522 RepID=UPI00336BD34D